VVVAALTRPRPPHTHTTTTTTHGGTHHQPVSLPALSLLRPHLVQLWQAAVPVRPVAAGLQDGADVLGVHANDVLGGGVTGRGRGDM